MEITIDKFVLDLVFNHIPATSGRDRVWWRETNDADGYVLIWEDGNHFHTYRYPPDWY